MDTSINFKVNNPPLIGVPISGSLQRGRQMNRSKDLYELALEKANECARLIPDRVPSQNTSIMLFGLLLAREELQGYKRTADDQELSDRVNSWIDPKLKFKGES